MQRNLTQYTFVDTTVCQRILWPVIRGLGFKSCRLSYMSWINFKIGYLWVILYLITSIFVDGDVWNACLLRFSNETGYYVYIHFNSMISKSVIGRCEDNSARNKTPYCKSFFAFECPFKKMMFSSLFNVRIARGGLIISYGYFLLFFCGKLISCCISVVNYGWKWKEPATQLQVSKGINRSVLRWLAHLVIVSWSCQHSRKCTSAVINLTKFN